MNEEIDTWATDLPVCPYCGHSSQDWYDGLEPNKSYYKLYCSACGREYECDVEYSATFCTSKLNSE